MCLGSGNVESEIAGDFDAPFSPPLPLLEFLGNPLVPGLLMPLDILAAIDEAFLVIPLTLPL